MHQARQLAKAIYYQPPVQRAVIKLVSPVKRPPYQTATMEFDYGLWLGISSLHCEDGRQLGEDNTWPPFFRERIATEFHTSNMPGSRAGREINMTTLHIVMKRWDDVMPLVSSLKHGFVETFSVAEQSLSLADLYLLSKCGVGLPALMARRGIDRVVDGRLPAPVATQFKIIAGIFMVVQHMLWHGVRDSNDRIGAAEFFDYADEHGIFISPSGKACGGSRKKIIELYEVIQGPASRSPALEEFAEPRVLFDYAINSTWLELVLLGCQRELQRQYYSALANVPEGSLGARLREHILGEQAAADGEGQPDFKCRGIWPLVERLGDARVDHPVPGSGTRTTLFELLELDKDLGSTDAILQHYRHCLQALAPIATDAQTRVAEILEREPPKPIRADLIARRLNVVPPGLLARSDPKTHDGRDH